ncbi:hypothetical protein CFter6_0342 [Collimonas fungivorans]|uniref:Uncharacterized protein n=1 Tax=Collimonas fungivorans TaxID=158899 RepID=A0A127P5Q2_9BURK|nr:hypothetical protein CFter6_0342 [Collimonas fungivorans]
MSLKDLILFPEIFQPYSEVNLTVHNWLRIQPVDYRHQ